MRGHERTSASPGNESSDCSAPPSPKSGGSQQSFADFYEQWRPLVLRVVHEHGVLSDVEDLVQQIFTRVWVSGRWRTIGSPDSYLWRSGRNEALKLRRRLDREVDFDTVPIDKVLPAQPDPHKQWQRRRRRELLLRLLRELPSACRRILRLRYIEGMSNREVAEATGISEKGVERQITSGVKRLRQQMATPLGEEWLSTFEDVGE